VVLEAEAVMLERVVVNMVEQEVMHGTRGTAEERIIVQQLTEILIFQEEVAEEE
jgi:hypothetical protein